MEENREQPIIMPATALNRADDESAMSEVGSQQDLGKFKNVQALMDAYNSLQVEFTKKCQKLSQLQKDKTECISQEENKEFVDNNVNLKENNEKEQKNEENLVKNDENSSMGQENQQALDEDGLAKFLESNFDASCYADEIKERFQSKIQTNSSPYQVAWAEVLLNHMKEGDKLSDPIINQYVLTDENVRNRIVEEYLIALDNSKPPLIISSKSGERLSEIVPDSPKSLADAKRMVDKMFS